jgi:hypothetical protein
VRNKDIADAHTILRNFIFSLHIIFF